MICHFHINVSLSFWKAFLISFMGQRILPHFIGVLIFKYISNFKALQQQLIAELS